MIAHINNVCRSCYLHLRNINQRTFLSDDSTALLVHAFISSKLDFMNSILVNIPDCHLRRLQAIQNTAARIVTRTERIDHITPVLITFHWLPIKYRIIYKKCLLTFKVISGTAPKYLCNLVDIHAPVRSLRSSHQRLLREKRYNMESAGA